MGSRLLELAPAVRGSQDAGSRNLDPVFLIITVHPREDTVAVR